jgi:hypothetical protein
VAANITHCLERNTHEVDAFFHKFSWQRGSVEQMNNRCLFLVYEEDFPLNKLMAGRLLEINYGAIGATLAYRDVEES